MGREGEPQPLRASKAGDVVRRSRRIYHPELHLPGFLTEILRGKSLCEYRAFPPQNWRPSVVEPVEVAARRRDLPAGKQAALGTEWPGANRHRCFSHSVRASAVIRSDA